MLWSHHITTVILVGKRDLQQFILLCKQTTRESKIWHNFWKKMGKMVVKRDSRNEWLLPLMAVLLPANVSQFVPLLKCFVMLWECSGGHRVSLRCVPSGLWVEVATVIWHMNKLLSSQVEAAHEEQLEAAYEKQQGELCEGNEGWLRENQELFHHLVQQPIALSSSPFPDCGDRGKSCCTFNRNVPALRFLGPFSRSKMLYSQHWFKTKNF